MIEINLKIERDIERLNKSLGEGWEDVTGFKATDVLGELVLEDADYGHTKTVDVLLLLMRELGYEVSIEEVLVDD